MATDAKTERAPAMHKAAINVLHERMPIYLCAERPAIPAPRRFATPSYRPAKTLEDVFRFDAARMCPRQHCDWANKLSASSRPS
jgi:hypothetical protein